MFEQLDLLFTKISYFHLNMLFLLGFALFGGTIGGRIFQKLHIPQVVGYIIIGLIIGESGLGLVTHHTIDILQPFNYFALGLIGFMVGGALRFDVIRKYGRQLVVILLCEGIAPFLLVSLLISFVGGLLFGDFKLSLALGLLFGAIASATDPAATTEVLREYKTRGPLTRTILGIVALDDGLALLLFSLSASLAGSLVGSIRPSLFKAFMQPLYEIGGAAAVGVLAGFILSKILRKYSDKDRLLAFSIGIVLLVVGLSLAIHVEMLLAAMALGLIVTNFTPRKSEEAFHLVGAFTPPIYVLFFVLVGARLDLRSMSFPTLILVGTYLFGTMLGKIIGSRIGARACAAATTVQRFLPFALFSQAGVAIGLSILAAHYFTGEVGNTLIIVITATTFISQIIGPPLAKVAITKSGEIGLNITEDDLGQALTAEDIMDKNPPLIYKGMSLNEILRLFSQSDNIYYPVVDKEKKLAGIITVDNIKTTFLEQGLSDLLLAADLMEPVAASVSPQASLDEIKKAFTRFSLEFLPVVGPEDRLAGFIERRAVYRIVSTKLLALQNQAASLESTP